ncbi:MAG: hypothetical protein ACRDY2_04175 [Acidimicrobiales bacterium]
MYTATGGGSLARAREEGHLLSRAAALVRAPSVAEVPEWVERLAARARASAEEVRALRARAVNREAGALAAAASDGVVVARRDGASRDELRDTALAVRDQPGVRAVVLVGSPDTKGVVLVAAVAKGAGVAAPELIAGAAPAVGGGGGVGTRSWPSPGAAMLAGSTKRSIWCGPASASGSQRGVGRGRWRPGGRGRWRPGRGGRWRPGRGARAREGARAGPRRSAPRRGAQ